VRGLRRVLREAVHDFFGAHHACNGRSHMVFKATSCPRALRRGNKLSLQVSANDRFPWCLRGSAQAHRAPYCTSRRNSGLRPHFAPRSFCTFPNMLHHWPRHWHHPESSPQTGTPELWPDVPMDTKEWTAEDSNTLLFLERVILREGTCRPWVLLSSPDGARCCMGHSIRLGRRHHRHSLLGTAARAVRPCLQQRASRIILTPDVTVNPTTVAGRYESKHV
jgi:hypothetical protein